MKDGFQQAYLEAKFGYDINAVALHTALRHRCDKVRPQSVVVWRRAVGAIVDPDVLRVGGQSVGHKGKLHHWAHINRHEKVEDVKDVGKGVLARPKVHAHVIVQ